jgi:EAL and modified HD-GYP domain-containing signal transduction protein
MGLSHPLLCLHLVADRELNPEGLLIGFGDGDTDLLLPLNTCPDFLALPAALPCFVDPTARTLPPGLLNELLDAGFQLPAENSVHRSDETSRPTLPPTAQWLSGDWYLAPPAKAVGNQTTSRALALKLVQLVAADADTREIEDIFRRDPLLAYHLLRLVNSVGMGPGKRISSFSQAILILGRQQLKRWLNLLLFAASKDDHRAAMLLARAGVRARSMELLASAAGLDKAEQEQAFMAGMFSLLGVLFGMPLPEILQPLHLSDGLNRSLLEREGETGQLLLALTAAEHADSLALAELLPGLRVAPDEFNQINIKAHRWILGVIHGKQDMAND